MDRAVKSLILPCFRQIEKVRKLKCTVNRKTRDSWSSTIWHATNFINNRKWLWL